MMNGIDRGLLTASLMFLVAPSAASSEESQPAEFISHVGKWTIAGDYDAGGCIAIGLSDGATNLTVATLPNRSDYAFALSNPAWQSVTDGSDMRIAAHFFSSREGLTDAWDLTTTGVNKEGAPPAFNFFIDRSRNDNSSFGSQFSNSDQVIFLREKVPIARFQLKDSAAAIASLETCRSQLRRNPNFDPFAK